MVGLISAKYTLTRQKAIARSGGCAQSPTTEYVRLTRGGAAQHGPQVPPLPWQDITHLNAVPRVRVKPGVIRRSADVVGAQVLSHCLRLMLRRAVDDTLDESNARTQGNRCIDNNK
jgi:hypothetical protein